MGTSSEKQMQEKEEMFREDSGFVEELSYNPVGDEVSSMGDNEVYCRRCKSHVPIDAVHNCMGSHLKPATSLADWEALHGTKLPPVNEENEVSSVAAVKIHCYRCNGHVAIDEIHNCMGSGLKPTPRPKHNLVTERFGKRLDEEELPEPYTDIELMRVLDQCVREFLESHESKAKFIGEAKGAVDWLNRKYGRMSL